MHSANISGLIQQALQFHQAGNLLQAEAIYNQILAIQPKNIDALYLLGMIAHQQGNYPLSIRYYQRAIPVNAKIPQIHCGLGNAYREQKEYAKAIASYQEALRINSEDADTHYNLGIAWQEQGRFPEAIAAYRKALALNPGHADAGNNLGVALKTAGQMDEAEGCYRRVLEVNPNYPDAYFNLGVLLDEKGMFEESVSRYQSAIALNPGHVGAQFNLGVAYRNLGLIEDAAVNFRRTLTLNPAHAGAYLNLGATMHELGRLDEAQESYRKALSLVPDYPEIRYNLALIALAKGDYTEGWKEFEWRWQGAENSRQHRRDFIQPQWRGEEISGKTILLHAEQGLGDTMQFIRYAPLVAAKGAKVVVECQPVLKRLLRSVRGIDVIIGRGEPLPGFDVHCPLLSLPLVFGTTLETVPAEIPYLFAERELEDKWKEKVGEDTRIRVGLVWAGNPRKFSLNLNLTDRRRSCRLSQFAPLGQCRNARFFSLQVGEAAEQAANPPAGMNVIDLTKEIRDFADTAALMANLDLLVSVDTSVAHLAGAMGKPVWLLSRYDACWRWLVGREDSPWYPGMRLFRQTVFGDWDGVLARVAAELEEKAQEFGAG